MPSLYNCKHSGDQYRISKFDDDFNLEASYLCDLTTCECPAGHRPHCRHRQMLPKFIQRNYVGQNWFWDHDRGGWVQGWKEEPAPVEDLQEMLIASAALPLQQRFEPSQYPCTEEDCFGHVASEADPKVCGHCGTHIDSLRPIDENEVELIEPSAVMGDGSPHMGGVNVRVVAPAGLGQTSEQKPSSEPEPENLVWLPPSLYDNATKEGHNMRYYRKQELLPVTEPSPSSPLPSPTIRRRV